MACAVFAADDRSASGCGCGYAAFAQAEALIRQRSGCLCVSAQIAGKSKGGGTGVCRDAPQIGAVYLHGRRYIKGSAAGGVVD